MKGDTVDIARIKDGVVANIEVATQEWIDENMGIDGYTFVFITKENPAHIGLGWSELSGFEQPPIVDHLISPVVEPADSAA